MEDQSVTSINLKGRRWRVRIMVALLLAGLCLLGYRYYKTQQINEHFARNVKCSELARAFAKGRTSDEIEAVVISSFYSSARNSCVAALERRLSQRYVVQVVDPVTGEVMWVDGCSLPDECDGGVATNIRSKAKDALDKWADHPLMRP